MNDEDNEVESEVAVVYGEVFPGEAIDIAAIAALVIGFIKAIQECRASRNQQTAMVRSQHRQARRAAFIQVRREFPDKSRREQMDLAKSVLDRASGKAELVEKLMDDAEILCAV